MRFPFISLFCLIFILAVFARDSDYINDIKQWYAQRDDRLKQADSWLSVAGLFWLKQGENTFGSDASNDLRFPVGKADPFIGSFYREGQSVRLVVNDGVQVTSDGQPVSQMQVHADDTDSPTILNHRSLRWFVIVRGDRLGIRLKDLNSKAVKNFTGLPRFPIDKKWKIKARLETYDPPITIKIPDVLGDVSDSPCPGALVFEFERQDYKLYPVAEAGALSYFLIFSDETSGAESYGAGRFLYVPAVDENGETFIDFNKAVNPPCAFTPFATCPLPPQGNHVPFRVTAGEKDFHAHPE